MKRAKEAGLSKRPHILMRRKMVYSPTSSPILRSPPSSPKFSKSLSTQISPLPDRLQFRRPLPCIAFSSGSACTFPDTTTPPTPFLSNSLYEVLEIPVGATADEIKAAYRRLVRICHPDVAASSERRGLLDSGTCGDGEFIRIHSAYSTLSDPDKRAEYDRNLFRPRIQPLGSFNGLSASPKSSFCKYPRRNWETDQCW